MVGRGDSPPDRTPGHGVKDNVEADEGDQNVIRNVRTGPKTDTAHDELAYEHPGSSEEKGGSATPSLDK